MLGSSALDIAIGLVFVYLTVSLLSSAINELIENQLKNRSKDLERGVKELLFDENGTSVVSELYNHPLILSLFKGKDYATAKKNTDLPSYIPARNFALALMDIIVRRGSGMAAAAGGAVEKTDAPPRPVAPLTAAPAGTTNATAITPVPAAGTAPPAPGEVAHPLAALRAAAVKFPGNPDLSRVLTALIDAAGADVSRARQNIEDWFNSSMDRVSGWYKRRSQWFLVAIGLFLAVLGNVDSINIANVLSNDTGLRNALVAQAGQYAANQKSQNGQTDNQVTASFTQANATIDKIRKLGLPVGWNMSHRIGRDNDSRGLPDRDDPAGWVLKVLGLMLTAVAVSLGAPFWFDVLNKFIVVRSTVKPDEKSPIEASKD